MENNNDNAPKGCRIVDKIIIILFLAALYTVGIGLVVLKRPTESQIEKRTLATMPELTAESYFSGKFADDFTVYFSDTVPFRDDITQMSSVLNKMKGISAPKFYGDAKIVNDGGEDAAAAAETTTETLTETASVSEDVSAETKETVTEAPTETTTEEELVENIGEFTHNGIVVDGVKMYGDNAGVMLFGANNAAGARYAQVISKYKETLGTGVTVYNLLVPTSVEFYLPHKFSKYSANQKGSIDYIYSQYKTNVITIDAYSEIEKHKDEYIYARTDHHWTDRGAYYAYKAFCNKLGMKCPDIDKDYEVCTKEGYVGSLYGYTNDITLKNSPETFTYYKTKTPYTATYYNYKTLASNGQNTIYHEYASGANCYGVFLGTDAANIKITADNHTGRKICVFKESYGNAFVPYLIDNFDEIYVIDIRYFGANAIDYIKSNGITDVLFINNVFSANTGGMIDRIEKLYKYDHGSEGGTAIR